MRCPGQDMRYWKGDAAFEVACPKCAARVEFFKDESAQRCPQCGHRFPNPKISFNCAQWCEYAEQCLGITPDAAPFKAAPEAEFAGKILTAAEDLLARAQTSELPALLMFQHARELVSHEACNPRVVLAAALLLELDPRNLLAPSGERTASPGPSTSQPEAENLFRQLGMEDADIQGVCRVFDRLQKGASSEDIETKTLRDAVALAELTVANSHGKLDEKKRQVFEELQTQAGKERARALFGC